MTGSMQAFFAKDPFAQRWRRPRLGRRRSGGQSRAPSLEAFQAQQHGD
jgi:hypothetical protein